MTDIWTIIKYFKSGSTEFNISRNNLLLLNIFIQLNTFNDVVNPTKASAGPSILLGPNIYSAYENITAYSVD